MDNFDSNVEDWMMTEADVRRLRNHLMPVLESTNLQTVCVLGSR